MPVRCAMATLATSHFSATCSHSCHSFLVAMGTYASYSSLTTTRPCQLFRVTPQNVEMAPAPGSATSEAYVLRSSGSPVTVAKRRS
eukprot:364293-Chlamydomonas_euryale.AAC.2